MDKTIMHGAISRMTVTVAVLMTLSGCGIYGTFKSPQYKIPENACGDIAADSVSMGDVDWRELFNDDKLTALIDTALVNNTDLRTAWLKVEEAQASLKVSRLAYLPSADFSPAASFNGSWDVQLPVSASWEIDLFGSLRNAKRGKLAALLQSEAYARAVRSQLISTVASTYYSLLALDAQREVYVATEQSWRDNVEVTRKLMEAGRYNAASLSQTEANYCSIRNNLIDIEQQIRQTENQLCSLIGCTPQAIERGRLSDWSAPSSLSAGVPVSVLSNRPDVKQAEYALAEAFYATNKARSAFYPSLTISGSFDIRTTLYEAIGSLLQPLFKRGTLQADLRIAKAQQQQAEETFRQTVIDAGIEVNDAFIAVESARLKQENYARQVGHLQDAVRSTQLLMKNGSTTYLEVLTAQQTLLEAQIGEIANRFSEISGIITLYHALGGGAE